MIVKQNSNYTIKTNDLDINKLLEDNLVEF